MNTQRLLIRLVKAGSLAGLCLFFLVTLVYVMPLNPVKAAVNGPIQSTMGRYFPQNWNLFAPVPVSQNEAILVRCLTRTEVAAIPKLGLPGDWQDLTTPVIKRYQQQRLAAYERIHRPAANAAREMLGAPGALRPWVDACRKGDKAACDSATEFYKPYQASASRLLSRFGSSYCISQGSEYEQVAIRVRRTDGVPWSERHNKNVKPESKDYDVGTFPIDRNVARVGLYNGGNGS